ncbi:MAG: LD-carboxypeptidase [Bacteroidota bacterium]
MLALGLSSSVEHSTTNNHRLPIQPPLLKRGDKVAIVAPAFWSPDAENIVTQATKKLRSWGLEAVLGQHLYKKDGRFAGTDAQRTGDLQWAFDDPTIKAIFTLRGGYGTTRIVDKLDFTQFLKHPKWVIGFSDITTLLIQLHQLDIVSVHGEVLKNFLKPQYTSSIASLKTLLFEGTAQLTASPSQLNRVGIVTAPVVGGNLTLLYNNLETPSALDTNKKILVIEEVDEHLYALDRVMVQLKRTGKLQHLAGLVIGGMVAMKDEPSNPFGKSVKEIIKEHVAPYGYPVAFNFPIGHEAPNLAFPHGGIGKLRVEKDTVSLVFEP